MIGVQFSPGSGLSGLKVPESINVFSSFRYAYIQASLSKLYSTWDKATDPTLASNQQISLHFIKEGKEYGDDIESGGTTVTENVRALEQTLVRSPLEVMPEYAVLCTVHIAEDPFIAVRDRVHFYCLDPVNKV